MELIQLWLECIIWILPDSGIRIPLHGAKQQFLAVLKTFHHQMNSPQMQVLSFKPEQLRLVWLKGKCWQGSKWQSSKKNSPKWTENGEITRRKYDIFMQLQLVMVGGREGTGSGTIGMRVSSPGFTPSWTWMDVTLSSQSFCWVLLEMNEIDDGDDEDKNHGSNCSHF